MLVCLLPSGQHSFHGNIYNLRLWDYAMTAEQLHVLSCDAVGNIIDWDNNHWDIPSSLAETDATLSCSESCNHDENQLASTLPCYFYSQI